MKIEEIKNDKLTLHLIAHLILEYRTSLSTICKVLNLDEDDAYEVLMDNIKDITIKKGLIYVLEHETKQGIIDQNVARRKAMAFLTKLHILKDQKEKLKLIKSISDDSEIIALQSKSYDQLSMNDFEKISKYRYKYAMPRKYIEQIFNFSKEVLQKRESKLDDNLQLKLDVLNKYHDYKVK